MSAQAETSNSEGALDGVQKEQIEEEQHNPDSRCTGSPWFSLLGPWTPRQNDLTGTHVVYLTVVLFGSIGSSVFSLPFMATRLGSTSMYTPCPKNVTTSCYIPKSAFAVHRTGVTISVLFLVLSTVYVIVRFISKNPGGFHAGFWIPKALLLAALGYAAFELPYSIADSIWGWIGVFAWLMFSFIQLAFTTDLVRSLNGTFKTTSGGQPSICFKVITSTILVLLAASLAVLYLLFGQPDKCKINIILITVNAGMCILVLVVSSCLSKKYKAGQTCWTGLFQAELVCLYVIYVTWSALMHGQRQCTMDVFAKFGSMSEYGPYIQSLCGGLFMCIIMSYAFLRNESQHNLTFALKTISNEGELRPVDITQEELDKKRYSCCFVYFVLILSSLYASTTFVPPHEIDMRSSLPISWVFMGVKSITSVLIGMVYLWILMAPIINPEYRTNDFCRHVKDLLKFFTRSLYSLLFEACPGLNQSKSTRFIYTFFFLCGTMASSLMYLPAVRKALGTNKFFCNRISRLGNCMSHDPGYLAVYRICLSMATFYLLFAVILYNVKSYADPRALIQNGLWLVKCVLFFGLLVCTFFIPLEFSKIWTYVGLVGTFFFIVIQMLLLVDFSRVWNTCFARKTETTGKKIFFRIIVCTTVALYVVSIASIVCFYMFFVGDSSRCRTNKMFISMNLVLCGIASMVSIHPDAVDTGLLQASAVTVFTMYLTLSGLSYNPNEKCNPVASFISEVDMRPNVSIQAVLDLILTVIFLVYFSYRVVSLTENLTKLAVASIQLLAGLRGKQERTEEMDSVAQETEISMLDEDSEDLSEEDRVPYSYTFYHLVYFLGSLHIAMVLTNWYTPKNGSEFKLMINWAAMCIKMSASSLCVLLYIWSIVVPIMMSKPEDQKDARSPNESH